MEIGTTPEGGRSFKVLDRTPTPAKAGWATAPTFKSNRARNYPVFPTTRQQAMPLDSKAFVK